MCAPRQIHLTEICMGFSKNRLAATKTNSWLAHRMGLGRFRESRPGAELHQVPPKSRASQKVKQALWDLAELTVPTALPTEAAETPRSC
jgi:hypothetical protein